MYIIQLLNKKSYTSGSSNCSLCNCLAWRDDNSHVDKLDIFLYCVIALLVTSNMLVEKL